MKYLLLFSLIFFIKSDSNFFKNIDFKWYPSIFLKTSASKLKPGDIIIKKKELAFLEWFGHCGIVVSNNSIAEIVCLGSEFKLSPFKNWYNENRQITVFRLKNNVSSEFRNNLFLNISNCKGKKYGFVTKNSNSAFYCSQFIWYVFNVSSVNSKVGFSLDSDNGFTVWPYDILFSKELVNVPLE